MEFLANILSNSAESASSTFTAWVFYDEPECPEELI